jgi:integrase/recombinase XerD
MNNPSQVRFVGPLAPYMAGYRAELEAKGYRPSSVALHLQLVAQVSRWLEAQDLGVAGLTPGRVEMFFALRRQYGHVLHTSPRALNGFLVGLERQGALSRPGPAPGSAVDRVVEEYHRYLLAERGLVGAAARRYAHIARLFLDGCTDEGELDLGTVTAARAVEFLRVACLTRKASTAKSVAVSLRSLLRFLYLEGLVEEPIDNAVPTPSGPSTRGLPKALRAEEVARLLSSCDRQMVTGRRDYAILLLLARLGLRAGEVAGLAMEDVDWREGTLRVRGKGRVDVLPLPAEVGRAVEEYIRKGRPKEPGGALFRGVLAPHGALSGPRVTGVVYAACERAGLDRAGAHRLRHTVATQMLRNGSSLTDIAQVLRHKNVDRLRMAELARPWPGSQP